ncbi:histone family protein DNA-binding protein [Coraliomargarita sp. CAG:312]|jgi:histone family protein DNA-binding protein|nr:histone family protein DNA-binding protein [Coraliomargarita sp. CAG:312]
MNKAELIVEIQKQLGKDATKACAEKALNTVLDAIKAGVKKHKKLQLIGFGTFSVVERKARTGINPQTKEKIKIKASKVVKFKPGAAFKASK